MITEFPNVNKPKSKSCWFLVIGIILIILGCLALSYQFIATLFSDYFIGAILIIAGVTQLINAFNIKGFGHATLWAIIGILYIVTGFIAYVQPIAFTSALTLILAILLIMSGIIQLFASYNNRNFPNWGWILVSGLVTLFLGILILLSWPGNSFWILGIFLGIDLVFQGWAYVCIGFALKKQSA